MYTRMDCVPPARQFVLFSQICSAHFGFHWPTRFRAQRDAIWWTVRVLAGGLLVYSRRRQRGFEVHVSEARAWPDRLRAVFRLWRDVVSLDYTAEPRPVVASGLCVAWLSLLDLAQIVSVLHGGLDVQVEFPARLYVVRGGGGGARRPCVVTLDFRPPRAELLCEACSVSLGGPRTRQRSHRFLDPAALLQFCSSALSCHRRLFAQSRSLRSRPHS